MERGHVNELNIFSSAVAKAQSPPELCALPRSGKARPTWRGGHVGGASPRPGEARQPEGKQKMRHQHSQHWPLRPTITTQGPILITFVPYPVRVSHGQHEGGVHVGGALPQPGEPQRTERTKRKQVPPEKTHVLRACRDQTPRPVPK